MVEVRGQGLMLGIELDRACAAQGVAVEHRQAGLAKLDTLSEWLPRLLYLGVVAWSLESSFPVT